MSHLMKSLIATSLFTTAALAEASAWTADKLLGTKVITDPQLSPDRREALYVATDYALADEKGLAVSRVYRSGLGPITGPDSSSMQPRWSPNGDVIAYVSKESGVKRLYLVENGVKKEIMSGGEKDVHTYAWSPDGKKIAFVRDDKLWIYDGNSAEALTGSEYIVKGLGDFGTTNVEFDWSPDGTKITFSYTKEPGFEAFYIASGIGVVDIATKKVITFVNESPFESQPRFSPDGKWIAYLKGTGDKHYGINRVAALRSLEGETKELATTPNGGPFLAGPNLLGWNKEASGLIYFEPKGTKFDLYLIPIDGSAPKALIQDRAFIKEPTLSPDRSAIAFVKQSSETAPEVYYSTLEKYDPVQLTEINTKLPLATPTEKISWESEGLTIEGLLTYPKGYKEGEKYPLLLVIHGGPMGMFDETYLGTPTIYPLSTFAEEGYFILRVNPRGSSGYGIPFRLANFNDWGGKDMLDLLRGVDYVIGRGLADENRLGVMGWSYGGYMTAWLITQTNRFKAASCGAGICDIALLNRTTDLYHFIGDCLGTDEELYKNRSPITYVKSVETPCLIQHGTDDKRVPVSQAYEWFNALEKNGKVATLQILPEMGHRVPNINLLRHAMQANLEWFNHYLKGEPDDNPTSR